MSRMDYQNWQEASDDLNSMAEARSEAEAHFALRRRLAVIIHESWSAEPFDATRHPEDLQAADAIITAFPKIAQYHS